MNRLSYRIITFLICLTCFVTLSVEAASLKQIKIILGTESNEYLENYLREHFPEAEIIHQEAGDTVDLKQRPALILMPEHQAYPLLEQGIGKGFLPLYRSSLIFGRLNGQGPSSWSEIDSEKLSYVLGSTPQRYLISALKDRLSKSEYKSTVNELNKLYESGAYRLYNSPELRISKPLLDILEQDNLPDLIIAWDQQINQLNLKLAESGRSERYSLQIPAEGSLLVDFGLYATDRNSFNLLQSRLGRRAEQDELKPLLELGYRSPDGMSSETFEFPSQEDYYQVSRIKNYLTFNDRETSEISAFKHDILGLSRLSPASRETEFLSYLFLTIALMTWLAFLFYRLDEPRIRLPLRLYIGTVVLWLLLRMGELLLPEKLGGQHWQSLWLILLIAGAWLFLSYRQLQRWNRDTKKRRILFYSALGGILFCAIFALTQRFHQSLIRELTKGELNMSDNPAMLELYQAGPGLYLIAGYLALVFLLGYYFLYKAREQKIKLGLAVLPALLIVLAFAYNIGFLFQRLQVESAALVRNNAILAVLLLELTLQLNFLPVNTKYFRFFRYNPLNMRLISNELEAAYGPEDLGELSRMDKLKLRRIIRQHFEREPKSSLRFGLKKLRREPVKGQDFARVELDDGDGILSLKRIPGGYLLWLEDVADLHRLRERLTDLSNRLEEQQRFLKQEQDLRSQLASQKIRRALFSDLEVQLSEKMSEINELIQKLRVLEEAADEEAINEHLAKLRIMVSQAKRKSNLLVRQESKIELEELRLIFREALQDAESAGITGFVVVQGEGMVDTSKAILCYDFFQEILQENASLGELSVFVTLQVEAEKLYLRLIMNHGAGAAAISFAAEEKLAERFKEFQATVEEFREEDDLRIQLTLGEVKNA